MDAVSQEQVRKVQQLSRYARGFCRFLYVVMAAATLVFAYGLLFGGPAGMKVNFGPYQIPLNQFLTPGVKTWGVITVASIFTIVFSGLFHLHGLFSSFVRGEIYTQRNVRHIHQLGVLTLAMAILQIVIPIVSTVLLQAGVVDPAAIIRLPGYPAAPGYGLTAGALPGFITGGVILMASWIMDLGRKARDEADELRRDAELVV